MSRAREIPDGLPFRTYERKGIHIYSIGYKEPGGKWKFRLKCSADNNEKIRELRRKAINMANQIIHGVAGEGTFAALADAWLVRQESLPESSAERRAKSTLSENKHELETLKKAFGHMALESLEKSDAYAYLDACLVAVDPDGNPRPRPEKGNKEITLARRILEYGVRLRMIRENPFDGVEKLKTVKQARYVSDEEMALALEVGRAKGGVSHLVSLALKTAFLCVRRSVEVRALTRSQIKDEGILWTAAKRQKTQIAQQGLIEWSPELRATIDEALAIKRGKLAGTWYVFGNMRGNKYTKGGWKKSLSVLMDACEEVAAQRGIAFQKFSLQDCRPKGVSDKLMAGAGDVVDATMHTSERMVRQVYDRRRV